MDEKIENHNKELRQIINEQGDVYKRQVIVLSKLDNTLNVYIRHLYFITSHNMKQYNTNYSKSSLTSEKWKSQIILQREYLIFISTQPYIFIVKNFPCQIHET